MSPFCSVFQAFLWNSSLEDRTELTALGPVLLEVHLQTESGRAAGRVSTYPDIGAAAILRSGREREVAGAASSCWRREKEEERE